MTSRRILRLSGEDTRDFLQGLVTNDVKGLDHGLVYAALLTAQGKFIVDFFLVPDGDTVLLDVTEDQADMLQKRLTMYKLRAKVTITPSNLNLQRGTGPAPDGAFADPRDPALGWRAYSGAPESDDGTDWDALRVAHGIPETGRELTSDTFVLETAFERIHGVDFRKGCYVGQEVTARMKHKTELRKGLARVTLDGDAPEGTEITADGKPAGVLHTRSGDHALAYLRFDRAEGTLQAGDTKVTLDTRL